MKRIILLCGLLTAFFYAFSTPVEYRQSIPETGASISNFNFELQFDINNALEDALASDPEAELGIGFYGTSKLNASLYEGDLETGTLLGTTMNKSFNGKSEGFVVNGSNVSFSFDNLTVKPNQEYTIKITNKFSLYLNATTSKRADTELSFEKEPLVLKFVGATNTDPNLSVENSIPANGENLDYLRKVEFYLNSPFQINSDAHIVVKEGDNIVANSGNLKVSDKDNNCLIAEFSSDIKLTYKHIYSIILPSNSLSLLTNASIGNVSYSFMLEGSASNELQVSTANIEYDDRGLPTSAKMIFDMPEGTSLNKLKNGVFRAGHLSAYLSEEGDEENAKVLTATLIEDGKGMKWNLYDQQWKPATNYILKKLENSLVVVDTEGNQLPDYTHNQIELSFTTPTIESLTYPPLEFKSPLITKTDIEDAADYQDGMKRQYIGTIEFWLKDNWYTLDGQRYNLSLQKDLRLSQDDNINFYEVTPEGDKIIFTRRISHRNDMNEACGVGVLNLNTYLYEGKKYKLIIPEGYYTVVPMNNMSDESKANLIRNNEMVLTFEGAAPNKAIFEGCNIPDNSIVPKLYTVNWVFAGPYKLNNENATIKCDRVTVNDFGSIPSSQEMPVNIYTGTNKTYVYVEFMSKISGEPVNVSDKTTYTLTLPKGLLVNTFNDEIVNDEIVLHIKGGQEAIPAVDVNLTINDLHSASHKAVKGEKYSFTVAPNNDWKVESVMHGDKVLSAKNGVYTTEPLNENAEIRANLEYAGTWADYSETTGVWTVKDTNIRIYSDNQQIVVEGVTPDNEINVYSVSGLHINSTRVAENHDCVRITVATGQVYIVTVDGKAAKIQL